MQPVEDLPENLQAGTLVACRLAVLSRRGAAGELGVGPVARAGSSMRTWVNDSGAVSLAWRRGKNEMLMRLRPFRRGAAAAT